MSQALGTLVGGLLQGGVFALVAIGFTLIYRVTGTVNLAQGAFVVIGALTMNWLQTSAGWPVAGAFLGALVIAIALGVALGKLVYLPGLKRLPTSGMVMLSGGTLTLLIGASLIVWGAQPYQLTPWSGVAPVDVGGVLIPTQAFWEFGITLVLVAALWYALTRTLFGKALRAVAENPDAAALMGIDVESATVGAYTIATALGAVGGMVFGPIVALQFDAGSGYTTSGFIAAAIGGIGSFAGSLLGGILLGVMTEFGAGYISSIFASSLALLLLLAILVWRPNGLFSTESSRREDVRTKNPNVLAQVARLDPRSARAVALAALALLLVCPLVLHGAALGALVIAGIFFIAVIGLDVLMGYAGQVSLGHAAFMAIGGYGAAIATVRYGLPPLVGLLTGLVASLVSALAISLVTLRLRGSYLALATLAFGLLVDSMTAGLADFTGGPSGLAGIPHFGVGPLVLESPQANCYFVWGLAVVVLLLLRNLLRGNFGRALRSIRVDPLAAASLGIDVPRYKLVALLISAALASIAGSLYAFDFQFLSPDMVNTSQSIVLLAMLVIGGEGTLVASSIGVVLLTVLPLVIGVFASYKTLASGALLVVALLYFPGGIYGTLIGLLRGRSVVRLRITAAKPDGTRA